jgi:hypothetical protein
LARFPCPYGETLSCRQAEQVDVEARRSRRQPLPACEADVDEAGLPISRSDQALDDERLTGPRHANTHETRIGPAARRERHAEREGPIAHDALAMWPNVGDDYTIVILEQPGASEPLDIARGKTQRREVVHGTHGPPAALRDELSRRARGDASSVGDGTRVRAPEQDHGSRRAVERSEAVDRPSFPAALEASADDRPSHDRSVSSAPLPINFLPTALSSLLALPLSLAAALAITVNCSLRAQKRRQAVQLNIVDRDQF